MNKNEKIFLAIIVLVAIFLCFYRLGDTQLLIQDTARDTLKILTLWQNKSITLIGPPASFSLNSIKEFYFGSFPYYLAMLGLIITGFNPTGATVPTIIIFIFSIPVFYLFLKNIRASGFVCFLGTILYVVSPLTVTHMRFFWNPNTIIPLSVFYWYLATLNNKTRVFEIGFLAGLVAAVIFNFHYFMVIPMVVWGIITIFKKEWDKSLGNIFGFLLGTIPLFLFELKHEYYLTNSLIYNFSHKATSITVEPVVFLGRLGEVFMTILGIKSGEIYFGTLFNLSKPWYLMIGLLILFLLICTIYKIRKHSYWLLLLPLAATIIFAARFSDTRLYSRYIFGGLPLIIWIIAEMFSQKYLRYILIPILVLILYSNFKILTFTPSISSGYVPLKIVEKIADKIIADKPEGKYNLSENIFGDAQALGLRYFIQRDAKIKPQNVDGYGWLNTLYVVSPSLEKIKSDNRWEFYASAPWNEPIVENFGEVNLYKFQKPRTDRD